MSEGIPVKFIQPASRLNIPNHPRNFYWTEEFRDWVQKLIDMGLTYDQIGERCGRTGKAIYTGAARWGLRRPRRRAVSKIDPELIERIRQFLHQDYSYSDIGLIVGKTRFAVAGIVWRFGLNDLTERPESFKITNGSKRSFRNRQALRARMRRQTPRAA